MSTASILEAAARRSNDMADGLILLGHALARILKTRAHRLNLAALKLRGVEPAPEIVDPHSYVRWIMQNDTRTREDQEGIRAEIASWPEEPSLISVVMPVYDPIPSALEAAVRSVIGQLYPHWELCIVDDASTRPAVAAMLARLAAADTRIRVMRRPVNGHISQATNDAIAMASGAYVAFMDHDDVLPDHALYEVAKVIRADPNVALIYSDEDKIDAQNVRFEPHFKPDWNAELLYAQNYINHLTVIRSEAIAAVGGMRVGFEGSQDHDLLLRLSEVVDPTRIHHIPRILYHWRAGTGSGTFSDRALRTAEDARLRALRDLLGRRGWGHRAERGPLGFNRLVRALPDPAPLVSVIIPTRDHADLLAIVLDGLLSQTRYRNLEVIVIDNGSEEPRTHQLLTDVQFEDYRVRVIAAPGPFNFSALSNQGAAAARGDLLLFLNNDIEVIEPGWLDEMVSVALEPEIGAVGAKLLYPDGTIQHGGVILGAGGVAGHSHLGLAADDPGYFGRLMVAQEMSAVTGACLLMRRSVFDGAGGFDEVRLAIAFNDIDLCLRIRRAGFKVVWTPFAKLVHHESKSRGRENTPEKQARFIREIDTMMQRWAPEIRNDPYYNPNFTRSVDTFQISQRARR